MNTNNGGGVLGRIIALFLIVGAAYGAQAIARGTFACGLGARGSCCTMETPAASAPAAAADVKSAAPAAAPAPAPAKNDAE